LVSASSIASANELQSLRARPDSARRAEGEHDLDLANHSAQLFVEVRHDDLAVGHAHAQLRGDGLADRRLEAVVHVNLRNSAAGHAEHSTRRSRASLIRA